MRCSGEKRPQGDPVPVGVGAVLDNVREQLAGVAWWTSPVKGRRAAQLDVRSNSGLDPTAGNRSPVQRRHGETWILRISRPGSVLLSLSCTCATESIPLTLSDATLRLTYLAKQQPLTILSSPPIATAGASDSALMLTMCALHMFVLLLLLLCIPYMPKITLC